MAMISMARLGGFFVVAGLAVTSCGSASGCDDFHPASRPLGDGEEVTVELQVVDGHWVTPDIAANYWDAATPVPGEIDQDAALIGTAMVIESERTDDGQIVSGVVRVDLGQYGFIDFNGPIGCE